MFAPRYFAPRHWGPRYFGAGSSAPAAPGRYWGPRHFGAAYFAPRYFPGGAAAPPAGLAADALEAAVAYLSADAALSAAAPGGVSDSAPLGADWPYVVLSEPEGDNLNESEGGSIEPLRWQLSVFARGKAQARAVRRLAVVALQDAPLEFEGGSLLHLRAANFGGMKEEDPASGGADCWQEIQFFDVVVGRD